MNLRDVDHIAFAFRLGPEWAVGLYLIPENDEEDWKHMTHRITFPTRDAALELVKTIRRAGEINPEWWTVP